MADEPPFQRPIGPLTDNFFLNLVPSENKNNPKFMAWLEVFISALVDAGNVASQLQTCFDLDNAVGDQLDKTGEWIGLTRYIAEPLSVISFSFDTPGAGWDQADWFVSSPYDPAPNQVVTLDDTHYRTLLKARIASNNWDGTVEGAYAAWQTLFAAEGYQILIQNVAPAVVPWFAFDTAGSGWDEAAWNDNSGAVVSGGMHIILALVGPPVDPLTQALFTGGYLELVPAGVTVDAYATQPSPGLPLFAWDAGPITPGVYTSPPVNLAGWDIGTWAAFTPPVTSVLSGIVGSSTAQGSAVAAGASRVLAVGNASGNSMAVSGPRGATSGSSSAAAVGSSSSASIGTAAAVAVATGP